WFNGTVRALDAETDAQAAKRIQEIAESVSNDMGGSYSIECEQFYPVLKNDAEIADKLIKIVQENLGPDAFKEKTVSMGAEDFAWYLQEKPGAIFSLGVRKPGTDIAPLHNEKFSTDEDALTIAPEIFTQFVLENM
ncbi:MAG: M20/M25/M40 family metallo-hydrolase, partial [Clostridia bacterium]|nr:M20/M25/M40 family metallo-hydrolase [Clostridia bacterium]